MKSDTLDDLLENGIFALVAAVLVLMPLDFGGSSQAATGFAIDFLIVQPFILAEWLILSAAVLWAIRLWIKRERRVLWPPMCWAVLAFTAYAIWRYFNADIEYVARQEVIAVGLYAVLFFVIVNNLHHQESTQRIAFILIILAVLLSFYAIFQYVLNSDRVWHLTKPYHHRGSATFISPNHLGGFLEMVLPIALAFTIIGRFKALTKVLLAYASLTIMAGIAVTMSRGTWIATTLSLIGFFGVLLFYRPFRLPSFIALGLLGVIAFLAMPLGETFKHRAQQMYKGGKLDDDARFALWKPALKVWEENVWVGAGPAHFDYRFGAYRPEAVQARPYRTHNDFLNTLADYGMIGCSLIGAALTLLTIGLAKTWGHMRKTPRDLGANVHSTKTAFVLGASAGLAAIFLHSVVDFNMHMPANAILAVALMALLSGYLRFATEKYWFTARLAAKFVLSTGLLCAIVVLGHESCKSTREAIWLARAQPLPNLAPAKVTFLEKAFAIEPKNSETARKIGEALRFRSRESTDDYVELAQKSLDWYGKAMRLNPWDSSAPLFYGWCLDWLGRVEEAEPYFKKAEQLDPNNYWILARIGIHYVEANKLTVAKAWFERSLRLEKALNQTAGNYLEIVKSRLESDAVRNGHP